ncbi:MAG: hypothetical protein CVU52_06940 [Deltaproteobacteria bacterium HGW-Deltaproteobacteria-10]|nr:MAG: hypothetical protein CVU52_06940 [Deltaproteobacteria bacterium HGW-Deltaproteobacteria-10]
MKRIIFALVLCLITTNVFAQDIKTGNITFIPVSEDANITQKKDGGESDLYYVIDGDESMGKVLLTFDIPKTIPKAREMYLIVNIPNKEWAESADGFEIGAGKATVGMIKSVARNSWVEIKLNVNSMPTDGKVELVLKTAKTDGLYVCSKKSGRGAYLKIIF